MTDPPPIPVTFYAVNSIIRLYHDPARDGLDIKATIQF